jgi:hypothetical protein
MKIRKCAFLTAAVLVIACGKSGVGGLLDIFIPDFSNGWTVEKGQPKGIFFLISTVTDSATATGILEGNVNLESDGTLRQLKGSFKGTQVSLTILASSSFPDNPPADSTFTGKYDTLVKPNVLRLKNDKTPFDSLVLRHG